MKLSVKTRQSYLKELGYYKGNIDGIEGRLTKSAYLSLQKDYFTRDKDIDGIYGTDTDILLRNVYMLKDVEKFKVNEFKCKCEGLCTGYPSALNEALIQNLKTMRKTLSEPITITSGLRCKKHNESVGGATNSRHLDGKAVDVKVRNYTTLEDRKTVIDIWVGLPKTRYGYTNKYSNNQGKKGKASYPNMKTTCHLDIL